MKSIHPKSIEKEIALFKSKKTIAFTKQLQTTNNIIPQCRWFGLALQIFEIEIGILLVKNHSEKWVGLIKWGNWEGVAFAFLLLLFVF